MKTYTIILITFATLVCADSASQTNWSGGSGIQGPVSQWDSTFYQADSLNYTVSGFLQLDIVPDLIEHIPDINTSSSIKEVLWGDIDMDGDIDLLEVTTGDSILWHEQPSSPGTWSSHFIEALQGVRSVALIKFESSTPTWVVNHIIQSTSTVTRYYYNGWSEYIGDLGDPDYGTGVTSGDVDGNGTSDIIGWKWGSDEVWVWWSCDPDSMELLIMPHTPSDIFVFDGDGDGDSELAVDKSWYPETVVYWNTGSGFIPSTLPDLFYAYGIDNGDIDGDGISELTAISYNTQVLFWRQGGGWIGETLTSGSDHCAFVDLEDDSDTDVIGFGGTQFHFFYNCDQSYNLYHRSVDVSFPGNRLECADMNLDGIEDLVLTDINTGQIRWYEHNSAYQSTGSLESSILYLGSDPGWGSIDWDAKTPSGTSVAFLVRASDDWENMGVWSDTLYSPCSLSGILQENDSYLQYKAILATDSPDSTPTLEDISITWDPLSTDDITEPLPTDLVILPFTPNPSPTPILRLGIPEPSAVDILIFDVSGRIVSEISGDEYSTGYHDIPLMELSQGIYFCWVITGVNTATQRFVVIE